mmetsp:Transcript_55788/g.147485  ORF Transcript_55788/g.147485 Transcript_55788/m.147485 type:complete len:122 (+) Transcript_55788:57-422(+)
MCCSELLVAGRGKALRARKGRVTGAPGTLLRRKRKQMQSTEKRKAAGGTMGTKQFDNGRYDGEMLEGAMHGRGIRTWWSGARYEGEFKNDVRAGQGKYLYADGSRYEGGFQDNMKSGRGEG